MIDLRFPLPDYILANGQRHLVRTGWRFWVEFGYLLERDHLIWRGVLLDGAEMTPEIQRALVDFWACKDELPREMDARHRTKVVDLMIDGSLVVAAFQQAYGIDLTSPDADDMHWHRFRALLSGLPVDTALAHVMSVRGYDRATEHEKRETAMMRAQRAWALPGIDDDDWLDKQQQWFGAVSTAD